jgi:hypothetical protein
MRALALLVALFAMSGCSNTSTGVLPSTTAPSASSGATASPPAVADTEDDARLYRHGADDYLHFASPSGNIRCDLGSESDGDFLACYVLEHSWALRGCPSGESAGFGIGDTEAEIAHISCGGFPTDASNYRALPYGHSVSGIRTRCTSSEQGMTCRDRLAPHGSFFVSKARYRLN